MKFEAAFLRSKVARRIFILFISCALIPIVALAVITFLHMTKQLYYQSYNQLHDESKAYAMSIFERLTLIEAEMKMVSSNLERNSGKTSFIPDQKAGSPLQKCIKGIVLMTGTGRSVSLFGRIQDIPELDSIQSQKLESGNTVVISEYFPQNLSRIFMCMASNPGNPSQGILLAEINPMYLWYLGIKSTLPSTMNLCILDHSNNVLHSSFAEEIKFPQEVVFSMKNSSSGQFEWKHRQEGFLVGFWSLFLKSGFFSPKWTVVLVQSKRHMLSPLASFKKTFPLVILISLWLVLFLSVNQIRKSLIPLEKLKEGTQRIARREFDSRIEVNSHDEFEDVADSFNRMAGQLGRQFKTLTTMVDIDRAILSALDTEKIINIVHSGMHQILPCQTVSVSLIDSRNEGKMAIYSSYGNPIQEKHVETIDFKTEELEGLQENTKFLSIENDKNLPQYLEPLAKRNLKSFVVLPLFIKEKLSGIISLGYHEKIEVNLEDVSQARQLADQIAVALSNAQLVEELNQFNWGTLMALARTIDAKSSWTAGHSERVAELALQIGETLGFSPTELDLLHRAGLLHDIGKIAVSHKILDKLGDLNANERHLVEKHVTVGARILEPILAYSEVIPAILQHHENFDGTGYPQGLSGDSINLQARVLAVADRFEALTADRPYRKRLDRKSAVEYVRSQSGKKFDPVVVKAFLEGMLMENGKQSNLRP